MGELTSELAVARRVHSSRIAPPPTPLISVIIHAAVPLVWLALLLLAFGRGGIIAWSVGLAYLAYDAVLLLFTAWQIRSLTSVSDRPPVAGHRQSIAVLVAAHNEATVLPATLRALLAQVDPPDAVVIADDGSTDATSVVLCTEFGFVEPEMGTASKPIVVGATTLTWLRLARGGKAQALNAAIGQVTADIVVTVDGDTLLDRKAIGVVRQAFSDDEGLVGITGIITPVCRRSVGGRILQYFQTYEYVRNFLGRYAWSRVECLQLISGAFAGFRRTAMVEVGGFDDDCLVEDYELVHRLRRYAGERGLTWRFRVLGGAQAQTEAPSTIPAFLSQRRRWFGGFLQTQWWYRAMVGDRRMGPLGTVMLPIKAIDTFQPIYGITTFVLLIVFAVTQQTAVLGPVLVVIAGKLVIDVAFGVWSLRRYRRWVGDSRRANLFGGALVTVVEPFTFRLLLHLGAVLGWLTFFGRGQRRWGRQHRFGLTNNVEDVQ